MVQIGLPVTLVNFLSGITTAIYRTISYSGVILIFLAAIQSVPTHLTKPSDRRSDEIRIVLEDNLADGVADNHDRCRLYDYRLVPTLGS